MSALEAQSGEVTGINPLKKVRQRDDFLGDAPDARAKRVRVVAKLLDNAITIPGTGWKIGLRSNRRTDPGNRRSDYRGDVRLHHPRGGAR